MNTQEDELFQINQSFPNEHDYLSLDSLMNNQESFFNADADDTNNYVIDSNETQTYQITFPSYLLNEHNYFSDTPLLDSNVHVTFLLEKSDLHACQHCDKKFATPTTLRRHIRCHTQEKPFKCQICDKLFSQQSNLWKHIRIHTGEQPFECPECKRKFSQRANMQKHMLIHSGQKPHECTYCWRSFTQLANLTKHVHLHLGSRPHECKYCQKRFSQLSNLKKHQHLHEEVKPFTCPVCLLSFIQQSNLKKHIALHQTRTAHPCQNCGLSYVQKISLIKHLRKCKKWVNHKVLAETIQSGENDKKQLKNIKLEKSVNIKDNNLEELPSCSSF